jgi:hypothetical protein
MPNNPIEVLKIILMITIPIGIAALTTWINITIRFAPDAAHAAREAKAIALKLAGWTANAALAGMLIWEIASPVPNPRTSILLIILYSFSLFNVYVLWLNRLVVNLIMSQAKLLLNLTEIVRILGKQTDTVSDKVLGSN